MTRKPLPTWSDFTDAELAKLAGFLVDEVEFATCATDRYAANRQRVALDQLHTVALEINRRRDSAARGLAFLASSQRSVTVF